MTGANRTRPRGNPTVRPEQAPYDRGLTSMAAFSTAVETSLLTRLAAGTAGVVGTEFLRRLVAELAAALDAELAFVAELCGEGDAVTLASAGKPGVELREGQAFALAGTPCEDAYSRDIFLVPAWRAAALSAGPVPARPRPRRVPRDRAARRSWPPDRPHRRGRAPDAVPSRPVRVAGAADLRRPGRGRARAPAAQELAILESRRQGAPADRPRPARRRAAATGRARPRAGPRAPRAGGRPVAGREAALLARASRRSTAGRELRELAQGLHPVSLDRGLRTRCPRSPAAPRCPCTWTRCRRSACPALVEGTVWFLVSEALSNAIKYAGASELRVAITVQGEVLQVRLSDDGRGGACPSRGTGLQGLGVRVETLGGTLSVEQPAGHGHDAHGTSAPAALISGSIR